MHAGESESFSRPTSPPFLDLDLDLVLSLV